MKFKSKYLFEDYVNKPINYLTPISKSNELAKDGSFQWVFRCVCGKEIVRTPNRVLSGHIKSCGCMRYKNIKRSPQCPNKNPRVDPMLFIGQKNNLLTVIDYIRPTKGGRLKLKCKCDCGNITYVYPYQFSSGQVKSCGCLLYNGSNRRTHGLSKHPLYLVWHQMITRCYNPNAPNYERYGGRGITVCDEWLNSPNQFIEWAESFGGKKQGMSLERIDNNSGYSPDNCRWATNHEQSRNKRSNYMITYNNKTQCLQDWSSEIGISSSSLRKRLDSGWSIEKALTTPVKQSYKKDKAAP